MAGHFALGFPELRLSSDRRLWSAPDVLQVISSHGGNLSGNLLLGESSYREFLDTPHASPFGDYLAIQRGFYPHLIRDILDRRLPSSVGGERPKLVIGSPDGRGAIVKFTPPLTDHFGRRWADLFRMEAIAAATLRQQGFDAAESRYVEAHGRGFLEIERFDRLAGGGRVGHVTLFNLGVAVYDEASDPEIVIAGLVRDGHLPTEDAERFARQHAFSKAIANTDTHLGNYGLLIDDDGNARLSPAYDVLPMAFAPKHDELPDRLVKHTGPRDAATDELVQRLIAAVEADKDISAEFRESWLRVVR
jgi:hypothetical protein